jgi:hypothetical protein
LRTILKFGSFILLATVVAAAIGMVRALPAYNVPATYHIIIDSVSPELYTIQVRGYENKTFCVGKDGQAKIDVPVLPRKCSWMCFGFMIVDGSPKATKVIWIIRNGTVLRRLSVRDLERIPPDPSGAKTIKL